MDLAAEIEAELQRSPGQSASEVAINLRKRLRREVSRRDVNSALYSSPTRFRSAGEAPPIWWVIGKTESNDRRQRFRTTTPSVDHQSTATPQWSTLKTGHVTGVDATGRRLYAWQAEALNAWRDQGNRGVVEAVTGTGKTMLGVVAIEEQIRSGARPRSSFQRSSCRRSGTGS